MNRYLACYAGPGGPLSAMFDAPNLDEAVAYCVSHQRCWFDCAVDALGLEPGDAVRVPPGWQQVWEAQTDTGWDLYERPLHG